MADINPDSFTLRQVDALREDYAQVMEELDLVKELLARLPTRREQAFTPLRILFGTAVLSSALTILWFETFWQALSNKRFARSALISCRRSWRPCPEWADT